MVDHCKESADQRSARIEARLAEADAAVKRGDYWKAEHLAGNAKIDALAARLAEAVAAVQAFADHFGPLEDNNMLNDECRRCFALARAVLGTTGSASGSK